MVQKIFEWIEFVDVCQISSSFYFLLFYSQVTVLVEEITKDKKVITLKTKRRKNSKKTKGFRRQVAILRITDISVSSETATDIGL